LEKIKIRWPTCHSLAPLATPGHHAAAPACLKIFSLTKIFSPTEHHSLSHYLSLALTPVRHDIAPFSFATVKQRRRSAMDEPKFIIRFAGPCRVAERRPKPELLRPRRHTPPPSSRWPLSTHTTARCRSLLWLWKPGPLPPTTCSKECPRR
jgi:hypothetical protein